MSPLDREAVEVFLQEASEHLQYLREYIGVLQEIAPRHEDLERLYIAAHTLSGTSASYGFPRFSEIAGKLAHVFQYSLNATLGDDLHVPLNFDQRQPSGSEYVDEIPQSAFTGSYFDALPGDDEVGPEILEFFQPE